MKGFESLPKVSKEYSEERRRHIIDAAYRCFARKGFHQTTMRDIFQEANLSAGAVYHYFESKDQIIQASFAFDYQRSIDLFSGVIISHEPLKALIELLDFFFNGLKGAAELGAGRVNVQAWGEALVNPGLEKTILEVMDSYRISVARAIAKAQETGQLDKSFDPLSLSQLVMSLYYGLELQLALNPQLDVAKYLAAVKTLLGSAASQA